MRFSLRSLLIVMAVLPVLIWANLRVSPQVKEYELYSASSGIGDLIAMRGWPLSPWMFATFGAGHVKHMPVLATPGVVIVDMLVAAVICYVACLIDALVLRAFRHPTNRVR